MGQARFHLSMPWSVRARLCCSGGAAQFYFQGVGGAGAPPFFHGVGGAGAPPFFQGVGGAGAPPFAIIREPSLWATTTVFKLIAPTNTSMARRTTASLRDIVPPRDEPTPETVYALSRQCQAARVMSLFRIDTHLPSRPFDKPSPTSMGGTVFDPVQDMFCDCVGQRYRGTRNYRTNRRSRIT